MAGGRQLTGANMGWCLAELEPPAPHGTSWALEAVLWTSAGCSDSLVVLVGRGAGDAQASGWGSG